MTQYVVDASVVIQRLIQDQQTPYVQVMFRQIITGDEFYVPEFCLLECANVLWKEVRFRGMPPTVAELLLVDLEALPLQIVPIIGLLKDAFQVGLKHQLALYDSVYIALAHNMNLPLITVDQRQQNAAQSELVRLKAITDFVM